MIQNGKIRLRLADSDDEHSRTFRFEYIRVEHGNRPLPWGERAQWIPAVDVYGNDQRVVIEIHVPGVLPEEIRFEFGAKWVRVQGSRRDAEIAGRREFFHVEISRGNFERVISLPEGLDTQKTQVSAELGVLRIEIPWVSREWAVSCRKAQFPEEWS